MVVMGVSGFEAPLCQLRDLKHPSNFPVSVSYLAVELLQLQMYVATSTFGVKSEEWG